MHLLHVASCVDDILIIGLHDIDFWSVTLGDCEHNGSEPGVFGFIVISAVAVAWWVWIKIAVPSGKEVGLVAGDQTWLV